MAEPAGSRGGRLHHALCRFTFERCTGEAFDEDASGFRHGEVEDLLRETSSGGVCFRLAKRTAHANAPLHEKRAKHCALTRPLALHIKDMGRIARGEGGNGKQAQTDQPLQDPLL